MNEPQGSTINPSPLREEPLRRTDPDSDPETGLLDLNEFAPDGGRIFAVTDHDQLDHYAIADDRGRVHWRIIPADGEPLPDGEMIEDKKKMEVVQ
jgi:hypothetical protein